MCISYDALGTLDLTPLPSMLPASATVIEFSNHIKEVHVTVRKCLESTYASVTAKVDPHC